jgi:hypothetical protein
VNDRFRVKKIYIWYEIVLELAALGRIYRYSIGGDFDEILFLPLSPGYSGSRDSNCLVASSLGEDRYNHRRGSSRGYESVL